jgi:DNA-binding transcriptional LysR family regulator
MQRSLRQWSLKAAGELYLKRCIDLRGAMRVIKDGVVVTPRVRPQIENSVTLVAKIFGISRLLPVARPAQLSRLDIVTMPAGDGCSTWQTEGPDGARYVHTYEPRYVADDLMTLGFAVAQGTGAAMLYVLQRDQSGSLGRNPARLGTSPRHYACHVPRAPCLGPGSSPLA